MYGWVEAKRVLGEKTFLTLKDRSGGIQVVVKAPRKMKYLNIGDVISATAKANADVRAPGGVELTVDEDSIKIISSCQQPTPLPLDHINYRKTLPDLNTRLDYRYLDLRNNGVLKTFKVKAEMADILRKFFRKYDFVEVHTPKIVKGAAEGGSNLFTVEYFDRDAFLAQSPQFYKQMMMASGLERVYEIAPAYRAERHDTPNHLNEFISVDAEMAFIRDHGDLMELQEKMISEALSGIKDYAGKIGLEQDIEVPKTPFPRITMKDAYSKLEELKVPHELDEDLSPEASKVLAEQVKKTEDQDFFFLTDFPKSLRPLYLMTYGLRPDTTKSFDLIYKGTEVSTGGQRIHEYDQLKRAFEERSIPTENYSFYLNAFKYGMPPHGGFGVGLERLMKELVGAKNIREVVLFPRDKKRLTP